jgi:hypothetical protein
LAAIRASHDAKVAIGAVLISLVLTLASPHFGNAGIITWVIGLIIAPISLVLASISMVARARCTLPKPKLPIFALILSVVYAGVLAGVWAFLWGLGHMH